MKSTIAASVVALSVLVLGGCSSMQDKSSVAKSYSVDDAAYIAQVEHTARDRGVSVHWVNPPKKRVASQL
ncbi:MAG TPA: hypothetical protein VHL61_06865 [Luteimonas sp.]|jgi:outer membrane murein-binding lipoprotein Lpp|nr:hypothetical protein [Luteimonas sp.]